MDGLNFDVLDRDDYSASYDSTYHDPHTQARADAFSQALDEARNDPRGNENAGGAQATSGAQGSNPPQTPIVLTAAAVGGTGSPPPDKGWASRLAQDPSSLTNKSADQIAAEFNAHGYPATVQQSTHGSGKAQMVRISKGPIAAKFALWAMGRGRGRQLPSLAGLLTEGARIGEIEGSQAGRWNGVTTATPCRAMPAGRPAPNTALTSTRLPTASPTPRNSTTGQVFTRW